MSAKMVEKRRVVAEINDRISRLRSESKEIFGELAYEVLDGDDRELPINLRNTKIVIALDAMDDERKKKRCNRLVNKYSMICCGIEVLKCLKKDILETM